MTGHSDPHGTGMMFLPRDQRWSAHIRRPLGFDEIRLAIQRARVQCDQFVIIEALPYFAQLMPNFGAIYGEVVSNVYLEGSDHLTPMQEAWLVDLGWAPPDYPCHVNCLRTDHPNFTRIWSPASSNREIAFDLLEGLMVAASARGESGPKVEMKVGTRVTRPTIGEVPGH